MSEMSIPHNKELHRTLVNCLYSSLRSCSRWRRDCWVCFCYWTSIIITIIITTTMTPTTLTASTPTPVTTITSSSLPPFLRLSPKWSTMTHEKKFLKGMDDEEKERRRERDGGREERKPGRKGGTRPWAETKLSFTSPLGSPMYGLLDLFSLTSFTTSCASVASSSSLSLLLSLLSSQIHLSSVFLHARNFEFFFGDLESPPPLPFQPSLSSLSWLWQSKEEKEKRTELREVGLHFFGASLSFSTLSFH